MDTEIYLYIYIYIYIFIATLLYFNSSECQGGSRGISHNLYFILTDQMKEISTYKAFFPAHETETITIS